VIEWGERLHVIAVAARKGGAGKTTVAWHLAVEALRTPVPVILLDFDNEGADSQQSLTKAWQSRPGDDLDLVDVTLKQLTLFVQQQRAKRGIIIVDTPPRSTVAIKTVIAACDLVLIPCQPSRFDLEAVGATVAVAKAVPKPFAFVLNRADARTRATGEARRALQVHSGVAGTLANRIGYADAVNEGKGVSEFAPGSPGAAEIEGIWNFCKKTLRMKG
jgi:chromosome partitioning protein